MDMFLEFFKKDVINVKLRKFEELFDFFFDRKEYNLDVFVIGNKSYSKIIKYKYV